jgi:hypothetical protein
MDAKGRLSALSQGRILDVDPAYFLDFTKPLGATWVES